MTREIPTNASLLNRLEGEGVLRTRAVRDAVLSSPRELYVWDGYRDEAYFDWPLPLGRTGQTISAPHMVVMMLEELDLRAGMKVLEIGSGSGWNAACIASIVGARGRVVSVELVEELVEFATRNIKRAGLEKIVEIHQGDGSKGWPPLEAEETYDRVVLTAAASRLPEVPVRQLRREGVLLVPLGDSSAQILTRVVKDHAGGLSSRPLCQCIFVPLVRSGEA